VERREDTLRTEPLDRLRVRVGIELEVDIQL
jgi:hypothetical protein